MKADSFREYVLEQLAGVGGLTCRSMFGGYGLYRGTVFFAIISDGRLYFKTDAASLHLYTERGMRPFQPSAKQTLTTYYEVPPEIIEDREQLAEWAAAAVSSQKNR